MQTRDSLEMVLSKEDLNTTKPCTLKRSAGILNGLFANICHLERLHQHWQCGKKGEGTFASRFPWLENSYALRFTS